MLVKYNKLKFYLKQNLNVEDLAVILKKSVK